MSAGISSLPPHFLLPSVRPSQQNRNLKRSLSISHAHTQVHTVSWIVHSLSLKHSCSHPLKPTKRICSKYTLHLPSTHGKSFSQKPSKSISKNFHLFQILGFTIPTDFALPLSTWLKRNWFKITEFVDRWNKKCRCKQVYFCPYCRGIVGRLKEWVHRWVQDTSAFVCVGMCVRVLEFEEYLMLEKWLIGSFVGALTRVKERENVYWDEIVFERALVGSS